MTTAEWVFSIIGGGVGIIVTVYIPMLMSTLKGLKEEFHKMNMVYERRLTTLEVMLKLLARNQQRIHAKEEAK